MPPLFSLSVPVRYVYQPKCAIIVCMYECLCPNALTLCCCYGLIFQVCMIKHVCMANGIAIGINIIRVRLCIRSLNELFECGFFFHRHLLSTFTYQFRLARIIANVTWHICNLNNSIFNCCIQVIKWKYDRRF